jgi:hypothetical protein
MIPNVLHYVYINERPWKIHHYLSVKSALVKAKINEINIWLDSEPNGEWWAKTKPLVNIIKIKPPTEIFGKEIKEPAHKSDVLRLEILRDHGGIYVDTDVLFVKPFKDLLDNKFVLGEQGPNGCEGLCPATILSEKKSEFSELWLNGFRDNFYGGPAGSPTWCLHSVNLPLALSKKYPDLITIVNHECFFWPLYHQKHIEIIFEENHRFPNAYSHHLWESSGKKYLKEMTEEKIRLENTTFTNLVKELV